MRDILAANIARCRKDLGLTQEALAERLCITFQAVSKWETAQTVPDTMLLPKLAQALNTSVDKLLGYAAFAGDLSYYEDDYKKDEYFWGVQPSGMCLKVLEIMPPTRPLKLLDIGCGEGKDAVFFARCGYDVSAFDISKAGLEKTKRLAEQARVHVRTFQADLQDYRLDEPYDVLYSSGVLHYIKPELRSEIMQNYKAHVSENGLVAFHAFVQKPFIPPAPDDSFHHLWKSGQLLTCFHDWYVEHCAEYVFNCNSSGIAHKHASNWIIARNGAPSCPSK